VAAPKRRSGWAIAALIIAGLLVFSWISNAIGGDETTTASAPMSSVDSGPSYEITAEDVVDVMPTTTVTNFCNAYYTIGDYEVGLAQFSEGYTQSNPSAEEVFDELLSRC
jgi:hypothetical protein